MMYTPAIGWQFGWKGWVAMISTLEAFNSVLRIVKSEAPDREKRAAVAAQIDRFKAGNPTASMRNRLHTMLSTSAKGPELPRGEKSIFIHALERLARSGDLPHRRGPAR